MSSNKIAYKLIKECSDSKNIQKWNDDRSKNKNAFIDLSCTDMENFYLQDANLKNINFEGTNLKNADLKNADVENTNISIKWVYQPFIYISAIVIMIIVASYLYQGNVRDIPKISLSKIIMAINCILSLSFAIVLLSLEADKGITLITIIIIPLVASTVLSLIAMIVIDVNGIIFMTTFTIVLCSMAIDHTYGIYKSSQIAIANSLNPNLTIGFNFKFFKSDKLHVLSNELKQTEEDIQKESNDIKKKELEKQNEKLKLQIKSLEKTNEDINLTIVKLLSPYEYLSSNINWIRFHNIFFYLIILACLGGFIFTLSLNGFLDAREQGFIALSSLLKNSSFGTIFGLILYFATPILFLISIITYSISQVNKNLYSINQLQEKRRNIKLLEATLNAKADIGADNEEIINNINNIATTIQYSILEEMSSNKKQKYNKNKERYLDKFKNKYLISQVNKLLRTKKS